MTQHADWGGELHQRIAAAIRNARDGRMSAQELADETARLGHPISRSQIANYESGRKHGLDVAELMIIAAALRIPPSLLLFPDFPDGRVELLPGQWTTAEDAHQWLAGGAVLPGSPADGGTKLVGAVDDRRTWNRAIAEQRELAMRHGNTPEVRKATDESIAAFEALVAKADAEIRKSKAQLWGTDDEGETDG